MKHIRYIIYILLVLISIDCAGKPKKEISIPRSIVPKQIQQIISRGEFAEAAIQLENWLSTSDITKNDSTLVLPTLAKCYIVLKNWDKATHVFKILEKKDEKFSYWWKELSSITSAPEYGYYAHRLSEEINSKDNEILPAISPDGKNLFFVLENRKNRDQDIYNSSLSISQKWTKRNSIISLNTKYADAILSTFNNGNSLLLLGTYDKHGIKSPGFSVSNRTESGWTFPKTIKIKGYSTENKFISATISRDGKTLLYALERVDGFGDLDIYVSFMDDEGVFSKPLNLGSQINTHGVDGTPFLAPDAITLYFSSSGHPNLGNGDMFVTRRLDNTWTNWEKPRNLGKELNTIFWDAYYTVQADGKYAYFSSAGYNTFGGTDIFRVELPKELRPKFPLYIRGNVSDTLNNPLLVKITISSSLDENAGSTTSDSLTGRYSIQTFSDQIYSLTAFCEDFDTFQAKLNLQITPEDTPIVFDIRMKPFDFNEMFEANNIYFEFNKWEIKPEFNPELEMLVRILKENENLFIEISGHTDSIGTDDFNLKLSARRARAVDKWLEEKGVNPEKISVINFGERVAIADNETEEGRALNRRVEFRLIERNNLK